DAVWSLASRRDGGSTDGDPTWLYHRGVGRRARPKRLAHGIGLMRGSSPSIDGCRPYRAQASWLPITWASARGARFSPGYNIAGLQPSESAYDLSHLGKVLDSCRRSSRQRPADAAPLTAYQWGGPGVRRFGAPSLPRPAKHPPLPRHGPDDHLQDGQPARPNQQGSKYWVIPEGNKSAVANVSDFLQKLLGLDCVVMHRSRGELSAKPGDFRHHPFFRRTFRPTRRGLQNHHAGQNQANVQHHHDDVRGVPRPSVPKGQARRQQQQQYQGGKPEQLADLFRQIRDKKGADPFVEIFGRDLASLFLELLAGRTGEFHVSRTDQLDKTVAEPGRINGQKGQEKEGDVDEHGPAHRPGKRPKPNSQPRPVFDGIAPQRRGRGPE